KAQLERVDAGEQSNGAIQAVEPQQRLSRFKAFGDQIGAYNLAGGFEFEDIVTIPGVGKAAEPFLGMGLENSCARAYDFAAFAASVAGRTDSIHTPLGDRKVGACCQRALARSLARSIDIKDKQTVPLTIQKSTDEFVGAAVLREVSEEDLPQGITTRGVNRSQKATESGAVRQLVAAKKRHKGLGKGGESVNEGLDGWFAANGIAKQERHKVDDVKGASAPTRQPYLLADGVEMPLPREMPCQDHDFGEPGRK